MRWTGSSSGAAMRRGCPQTMYFRGGWLTPVTLLFAETDRPLPLTAGKQKADSTRICADMELLRGRAFYEPYAVHLLNDIVFCCAVPRRDYDPLVRTAIGMYVKSGYREGTDAVCAAAGVSQAWLIRLFRKNTGMTPGNYFMHLRLEKAKGLLTDTGESISSVADICGFDSPAYFSNVFTAREGVSPRAFRKRFQV